MGSRTRSRSPLGSPPRVCVLCGDRVAYYFFDTKHVVCCFDCDEDRADVTAKGDAIIPIGHINAEVPDCVCCEGRRAYVGVKTTARGHYDLDDVHMDYKDRVHLQQCRRIAALGPADEEFAKGRKRLEKYATNDAQRDNFKRYFKD